ncbi:hypothetical protein [Streptomyces sp. SudanB5_2050]|uniref:hypothetical protein n=1 Tax=Streptomyces sp. SudanB5_2050 TaxID=3035274 RepID=UPI0036D9C9B9
MSDLTLPAFTLGTFHELLAPTVRAAGADDASARGHRRTAAVERRDRSPGTSLRGV